MIPGAKHRIKRSIALVIEEPGAGSTPDDRRWLLVRRPDHDEDLPGVWGLPAGSHREGESDEDLIRRIGYEKLGIGVVGLGPLNRGETDRPDHRLSMTLYAARITSGEPVVPQPVEGVTQYAAWAWGGPGALRPGAEQGSLCCRLGLAVMGEHHR